MAANPENIRKLLRQAKRYQFAAEQDAHPAIAFLHSSYAVALLDGARMLASDEEITAAIGEDYRAIRKNALSFQDKLQKMAETVAKKFGIDPGHPALKAKNLF
jgi:hypothetical protein